MTTKAEIVELLKKNPKAVARALVVLNQRQTADEQAIQGVRHRNGMGFTPADARLGTSMANQVLRRGHLTEKQLAFWLKPNDKGVPRICKYAGQLLEVAKVRAEANQAKLAGV